VNHARGAHQHFGPLHQLSRLALVIQVADGEAAPANALCAGGTAEQRAGLQKIRAAGVVVDSAKGKKSDPP
jgi:hypothetical protein